MTGWNGQVLYYDDYRCTPVGDDHSNFCFFCSCHTYQVHTCDIFSYFMVISTSMYDDLYVTFDIVPGTLYQVYYAAAAVVPCFFTPDNRLSLA